jgi:hypothetical protein
MKKRTSSSGASYACPACSETVDTYPDPGGGERQTYVEDCPVCCRPNVLRAIWDDAEASYVVVAERES